MFGDIGKYRIAGFENWYHIKSWRTIRFAPLIYTSSHTHARTHARTHTHTHTHKHTHTHVGFYGLRGLSIGVMVFILYKLYVLLPYTYPTPKLSPHRRLCISIFPQKNSLCMIYKCFKLWGHWKCPHKSPSPCNTCHTHVIIQICVLINHINMPTHTHTHTHTHKTNYIKQLAVPHSHISPSMTHLDAAHLSLLYVRTNL